MGGTARAILWGLSFALLAAVPFFVTSGRWIEFLEITLFVAVLGQGWNVLGGYGGQYSFGNAVFFGTGAYIQALMQYRLGLSPWAAIPFALAGTAALGAAIGWLSFRYGLRGSYFALITLAFAEAFHVMARSFKGLTEGGRGIQLALNQDPERAIATFQFNFAGAFLSRYGFYYTILVILAVACAATWAMSRSRFGAQLVAVRENEDAAEALGIDALRVKIGAIAMAATISAAGGVYYVQKFLYIEPGIAYGTSKSVEALFAPIIGGLGTVAGPILGSVFIHGVGEAAKSAIGQAFGQRPGVDLILFGLILIAVLAFMPRGIAGLIDAGWRRLTGGRDA